MRVPRVAASVGRGDRAGGCRHHHESDRRGSRAQCPEQSEVRRRRWPPPPRRPTPRSRAPTARRPHAACRGQGQAPRDHLGRAGFDQRADPGRGRGRRGRARSGGRSRSTTASLAPGERTRRSSARRSRRRRRHRARGHRLPGGEPAACGRRRRRASRSSASGRSTATTHMAAARRRGLFSAADQLRSAWRRPPGRSPASYGADQANYIIAKSNNRARDHHDPGSGVHDALLHLSGLRARRSQVRWVQDREHSSRSPPPTS